MVVAREEKGQLVMLDRIREMVRLAEGLNDVGDLDPEVEQRALDCLSRFGQRLRSLESGNVSTVGTNTLRRSRNAEAFIIKAEEALGFPIEIISGVEEARLIYQGVAHTLEQDEKNKLIVDIGGGSTELIIGEGFVPKLMKSLEMGCVMMTKKFFANGKIKKDAVTAARIYVLQLMKEIHYNYRETGWQVAIGSSGSIKSIENVIRGMQLDKREGISREALQQVLKTCRQYKSISELDLPGLSERRKPVFLGGLIVLNGVFEALDIEHMAVSQGALREGLLYDMMGRRQNNDIRNKSITSLANRFHINHQHAQRIEQTAFDFFQQLRDAWFEDWQHASNILRWACEVHEIGRDISHSAYQKHSAYIIQNADLAGFSRQEQRRLSIVVGGHLGKISAEHFEDVHLDLRRMLLYLTIVLRLSVIFHRSRVASSLPAIGLSVHGDSLKLTIPDQWLTEHPLTINDLDQENTLLLNVGINLQLETN